MKRVSVNPGLPREIMHRGQTIRSAIFKAPVKALSESWRGYFRRRVEKTANS